MNPLALSRSPNLVEALANEADLNPLRAAAHDAGMRVPVVSMDCGADCIAESDKHQNYEMVLLSSEESTRRVQLIRLTNNE